MQKRYILSSEGRVSGRTATWWRHKWKHFRRYWPFVREIHLSPVNSLHKGQWRGALMFSLICAWIYGLRRHRAHYDVIVMARPKRAKPLQAKILFFNCAQDTLCPISIVYGTWHKVRWHIHNNDDRCALSKYFGKRSRAERALRSQDIQSMSILKDGVDGQRRTFWFISNALGYPLSLTQAIGSINPVTIGNASQLLQDSRFMKFLLSRVQTS